MQKRIITREDDTPPQVQDWLNLQELAVIEMTSEDALHPIESALFPCEGEGWRAAEPGKQLIRLVFNQPQPLSRIRLKFVESAAVRTQEYVLRWSGDGGRSFAEIVRQQWNFSPDGATSETEEHSLGLSGVTVIELGIIPDITGQQAFATLKELLVA